MCGIIGVTGSTDSLSLILEGLSRLEYRGYDSAGVALQADGKLWRQRRAGKLAELQNAVGDAPRSATAGIGHTRWATHGRPTDANAHPHVDQSGRLALIHNGIIENYVQLVDQLIGKGHEFTSQTDTEVLAHLIGDEYDRCGSLVEATRRCLLRVEGSFAVALIHADDPELIVAARRGSPLVVGRTEGMTLLGSDIPALLSHTREIYIIDDDQLLELRPGLIAASDLQGNPVELQVRTIAWDIEAAEKGGYDTYMLKEMHEQPAAVRDTLRDRVQNGLLHVDEMRLTEDELRSVDKVFIVACGSSYHAGMVARQAIEHWTRLPVELDIASEFRYRDPVVDQHTLVVGVSQSGESIDTLFAARAAKRWGAKVLAVTNVVDSSLARESEAVLYTRAGPEVAVASTKAHLSQIVGMQVLALYLAQVRGTIYPSEAAQLFDGLMELPDKVAEALSRHDQVAAVARALPPARDFFYLGRGVGYPVALEGALKLKEISYLRAEGYPGGELKHGPIALIEPGTVVVGIATKGRLQSKLLANIEEVRARGATIILVVNDSDERTASLGDYVFSVPQTFELYSPVLDNLPLQLFAYELAKARGNDVDQPRNLAKVVTVE